MEIESKPCFGILKDFLGNARNFQEDDTLSSIPDANLDDGFAYWKEVIWNTKQEFRCRYSFPLAANNINIHSPGFVMEFIDAVV